ncbi:hypothetical protein Tco_0887059 [Tanacetum coccineum]
MSDSEDSTVTYTEVSSPFEDLSDIGSPGVVGPEYEGLPWMLDDPYVQVILQASPSPDYVPGPEEPEQAPPLPDFVLEPVYPEFMPSEDEEDPEEDDEEDPEEDPADYLADRGDDGGRMRRRAEAPSTSHPLPLPLPIVHPRTRASLAMLRAVAPSTYILAHRSEAPPFGTPPLLPIPLPTPSPPLLPPSTDCRADVCEAFLPP